jgi:hypothetical protein
MITRKRARERISLPAVNKFIYGHPSFADLIAQALITNSKFSDDVPELPEFNQFISTNLVNRSIVYPLDHLGDRWGIFSKIPTARSVDHRTTYNINFGIDSLVAAHSSLGEWQYIITRTTYGFLGIKLYADGVQIYECNLTDLFLNSGSTGDDGITKVLYYDHISKAIKFIVKLPTKFRNLFQVVFRGTSGGALQIDDSFSYANIHQINW